MFKPRSKPTDFIVGVMASHVWRKQIVRVIDAHRSVRLKGYPVKLLIASSTYDSTFWMPELRRYAQIVNPEVYFNPVVYQNIALRDEEVSEIYGKFTLLANPFTEGFGLTVLEAMACGIVPIVIPHGATVEVAGDCGLYVKIKDYLTVNIGKIALVDEEDLADKIIWAFENKDKVDRLRVKCIERAREFKWEESVKKLELILSA